MSSLTFSFPCAVVRFFQHEGIVVNTGGFARAWVAGALSCLRSRFSGCRTALLLGTKYRLGGVVPAFAVGALATSICIVILNCFAFLARSAMFLPPAAWSAALGHVQAVGSLVHSLQLLAMSAVHTPHWYVSCCVRSFMHVTEVGSPCLVLFSAHAAVLLRSSLCPLLPSEELGPYESKRCT